MMEAVSLSNRLQTVADMVTGRRVADIGCDHGFVSIYLVQAKKADHVLAADVRPGPLSRAQQHIKEVQLTPYIETRLSDGLAGVTPEDRVDTVILAGMGGRLMRRILGELDRLPVQELVLQPQSELEHVRRYVYEHGWTIAEEKMLVDAGKYYVVLNVDVGSRDNSHTPEMDEIYLKYGYYLIQSHSPVLRAYLEDRKRMVSSVIAGLENADTDNARKRAGELRHELDCIDRTLECI